MYGNILINLSILILWFWWVERGKIKGLNFYIGIGKKIYKNYYIKKVNFMWGCEEGLKIFLLSKYG